MTIKTIGVIGSTGLIGKPVTQCLVNAGFTVHALVRTPQQAKRILPPDVKIIRGDIKNRNDLHAFIKGLDALYLNLNLKQHERKNDWHAEQDGLANILEVSKHYPLKRIGFISSLVMNYQGMNGFTWWVFDIKKKAVQRIKESGIPYTIFYPSTFMDNFLSTYRMSNLVIVPGKSRHKMYFISASDYGDQVAQAFRQSDDKNKEYVIQGQEGFTAGEAATVFCKHYTKVRLTIVRPPAGLLRFFSKLSSVAHYGYSIVEALNNYPEQFAAKETWKDLGEPRLTLAEFATRSSVAH
jgi:uncharacterized protein YbjT (DUF2867 family)